MASLGLEDAKYIRSQFLRIAADASLHIRVEELLEEGADPNFQPRDAQYDRYSDRRWLFNFATPPSGSEEALKSKEHRRAIAQLLQNDLTALALAVKRGNIKTVALLLQYGANPNLKCSSFADDRTPLHEACRQGNFEIVHYLLRYRADPTAATGNFATTPLHEIAESGYIFGDVLVDWGANINARKKHNENTPLHIAAIKGYTGVVLKLHSKGADTAVRNRTGSTPLHEAAKAGHVSIVKILLKEQKDRDTVDLQNKEGRTALHEAVENGHLEVVKVLLGKRADPLITTEDDETALDLATNYGHSEIEKALDEMV
ncbi:Ankyrin-1 [Dactylellina cionopaga]|nr:Ankyrin-1 [Dactylellina cionopaga]